MWAKGELGEMAWDLDCSACWLVRWIDGAEWMLYWMARGELVIGSFSILVLGGLVKTWFQI